MKIKVSVVALRSALKMLSEVVARKDSIPVLRTIEIEAAETGLRLTGTNLDQTLHCDISTEVTKPGKAIVSARQMLTVIAAMPDGEVHLGHSDARFTITQNSLEYELPSWANESFPESPKFGATPIKIGSKDMANLIGHTEFAVTHEEGRYTLSAAKTIVEPTDLTMVTTDGHRLAFGTIKAKAGKKAEALIPLRALQLTTKLSRFADELALGFSDQHFFLKVGQFSLTSRLLSGQFPSYKAVYPKNVARTVAVDSKLLNAAIGRTMVMADDRSHAIKIGFNGALAVITAENAEEGKAKVSLPISGAGDAVTVAFNAEFLQDFLSRVAGDVSIELTDPDTQVRMRPVSNIGLKDYFYIVMPMRF